MPFVSNYCQFGPVGYDKKIFFMFSLYLHWTNWPCPMVAMLSTDHINLNNLGRESPKDHLCQLIANLANGGHVFNGSS